MRRLPPKPVCRRVNSNIHSLIDSSSRGLTGQGRRVGLGVGSGFFNLAADSGHAATINEIAKAYFKMLAETRKE